MNRPAQLILASLVVGSLAGGGVWWRSAAAQRAQVHAALPASPDVARWSPELRAQHERARARAQQLIGGTEGLAELSRLYHANGLLREAMRCYAALEQIAPREPRWPHRHATLLAGFGDAAPAITRWEKVISLAPDYAPARLRLAELWLKTNEPTRAAAAFQDLLRRDPENPHALLGLARIDFDAGRWTDARDKLERVTARTNHALGYDLIVSVYEKLGDTARATDLRSRAKASGAYRDLADPWVDELLADCHDAYRLALAAGEAARAGEPARARQLLERAVSLAPDDAPVRYQLATLLVELRDPAAAEKHLERCTQAMPTFTDAWAQWATLRLQARDTQTATQLIARGLQHAPDSAGLHHTRARILRQAGNVPAAIDAYLRALQLRANEAEPYVELATLLLQHNRAREALQHLERALAVEPAHPSALALLTLTAISQNDEASARRWLTRVRAQPRVAAAQSQQLHAAYRGQFGREFAP